MKRDELLIDNQVLHEQIDNPRLRILDCRWSLTDPDFGISSFKSGHIPKAQYIPLEPALSAPASSRGRHPLPASEVFLKTLSELGIRNDSQVVAYDDGSGVYACRCWWMLRWMGHSNVQVLDGGMTLWQTQEYPITMKKQHFLSSSFEQREPLTRSLDATEVLKSKAILLDARSQDRFEGRNETMDHKAGHIPGAKCYPFTENLTDEMTFEKSSTRFRDLPKNSDVICYCGSGVSATQNILALLLAGFEEPILYPGSWSEWIEDSDRPIATGGD